LPERNGKIPAITFTADGRFREDGALKVLDHDYHGNAFSVADAPGGGTYTVRDYTITFRYGDGRIYRLAYPGIKYDKADPSPAQLTVSYNDDALTKQ
ncbi:MAG TPA: hypothetical protein VLJ39_04650, partial [Tepidisphaeraceae bacterium]|nr:hypothetical protein [Tepidisphaeraceae bacterium]